MMWHIYLNRNTSVFSEERLKKKCLSNEITNKEIINSYNHEI